MNFGLTLGDAYFERAKTMDFLNPEQSEAAIQDLQKAADNRPSDPRLVHAYKADIHYHRREFGCAIADLGYVLGDGVDQAEEGPDGAWIDRRFPPDGRRGQAIANHYARRGECHVLRLLSGIEAKKPSHWRDKDNARANFLAALRICPTHSAAHYWLGRLSFLQSDHHTAIAAFSSSLMYAGSFGGDRSMFWRGLSWEAVGSIQNAQADIALALKLNPRNQEAAAWLGKRREAAQTAIGRKTDIILQP
ncbi:hypothetical protein QIH85_25730 [Bradyrhizobium japonicum]|uniref:tetratricopeptide repeat protein n=1 Tax=Bradyrhizobium japonicum TaxID=375 RepID=UPI0027146491|nr:tetratricopeptide repeat protein [Bradyrhizobium japonicum]WLB25264.1 hypothetical protein QIH85_25730 [Bradyrhizobium japonicum]